MSDVVNTAAPAAPVANANSAEAKPVDILDSPEALDAAESELDAAEAGAEASKPEDEKAKKAKDLKGKGDKELEKRIKKLKLKIDGKEVDEEINLDDDEYLTRQLQLAKMGQKRAQEKAELEKDVQNFLKELQKDPLKLLASEFGMNTEDMIEKYINEQVENAKKTPEQIEREKMEKELQSLKAEREREKEESKTRELQRLQQQEFERYDNLMEQALTKSDLPKSPFIVKKIADYMLVALEAGHDVTPEDVIPLVREEMHSDLKEMFQSLPEDVVEALLGEQVINKLRKRRVSKAQEAQKVLSKSQIQDTGKGKGETAPKSGEKKSFKEFFGV